MPVMPLFDLPFLRALWSVDFDAYTASGDDARAVQLLANWASRVKLKETASEAAFIQRFFCDLWGYTVQGATSDGTFQCYPQFPVARAGQTGGQGEADLALGLFSPGARGVPQVVCEFKDLKSGLDARQRRKGNDRSPVQQAFDYLRESRTSLVGTEAVEPEWAIVTDMDEFRLMHYSKGMLQAQRFSVTARDPFAEPLLGDDEAARFRRFLFRKMFAPESLIATRGPSALAVQLKNQIVRERDVEESFYREYKTYREHVYQTLLAANPDFAGTKGRLVRLTQRLLDRCLFLLFCEDMGAALLFPPNLFRDAMVKYSGDALYHPDDTAPWERLKSIFRAMDKGDRYGISRFNGGLFAPLPELENLHIPAQLFCAERQGEKLQGYPLTLLHFSANYNFGIKADRHEKVIDFYALGRIFEQSITELEIMEAVAEGRDSLNLLTKRKRDGVYYTPEWVTAYIVEETVGEYLREAKQLLGLTPDRRPQEEDLAQYRAQLKDKRRAAPRATAWLAGIAEYRTKLARIRVVDPACGSGAFLIQTLEYLKAEHRWIANESERVTGQQELWEIDAVIHDILTRNLYGVDINAESVEIAKLALWMHTAAPGKPLSSLDHNVRCGNSLVGPDFYRMFPQGLFSDDERERVNVFDWREAFPEVFAYGGFDCVVGNPPYVKLQHFRRVQDKVARYLVQARREDGAPLYESTQTGNFDLYLPFIELGISLLNSAGRMGVIAQNAWAVTEYGAGLRRAIVAGGQLERWLDFRGYQVFCEATTYTALQFFTAKRNSAFGYCIAGDGKTEAVEWTQPDGTIRYSSLNALEPWSLMADAELRLLAGVQSRCRRLIESCELIMVGIQTSADSIYHLERLDDGRFRTADGEDWCMESELMKPLISGPEAKRYLKPLTSTYLLFPYKLGDGAARLLTPREMEEQFPQAWAYLKANEAELRAREGGKMDLAERWFGYNYPKNLEKQTRGKLCVAQTVPGMRVSYDPAGEVYLNNVRVNGVVPRSVDDGWFLLGLLNARVVNFYFTRTAKVIEVEKYEANKQFIAPLPIPEANPEQRTLVINYAKSLQTLHTTRRDQIAKFDRRLNSGQTTASPQPESWLWANLRSPDHWKAHAPAELAGRHRTAWAKSKYQELLDAALAPLDSLLKPGAKIAVEHTDDELRLRINGMVAIELFDKPDTPLVAAQWRHALRSIRVTEAFDGKKLVRLLLDLRASPDENLTRSLLGIESDIARLDREIDAAETALNQLTYELYRLTAEEIALVEA